MTDSNVKTFDICSEHLRVVKDVVEDGRHSGEVVKVTGVIKEKFGEEMKYVRIIFKVNNTSNVVRDYKLDLFEYSPLVKVIEAACGEVPEEITNLEDLLIGKSVIVEVKNEEFKGRMFKNVVAVYPAN
tara:strand:+ start:371 stop:754 length:384 start_codon:yes stop_codon:yes gene_type:complete